MNNQVAILTIFKKVPNKNFPTNKKKLAKNVVFSRIRKKYVKNQEKC
jgi:hypothetical protein